MASFYQGIVSDNKDPDKFGRIKVALDVIGKDIVSDWLPMLSLHAGEKSGFFVLPEIDDQVIVSFLDEKLKQGFVLGSIWTDKHKPPETKENTASDLNDDGDNNLKFFKSRSGQQIVFDDKKDKEKIQILSKDAKTRFEFDADKKLIKMDTDQSITISAKKKIVIKAEELKLKTDKVTSLDTGGLGLKSSKAIKIEASDDLEAEGSAVKLN